MLPFKIFDRHILVPNLCLGSQLKMLHFLSRLLFRHLNVVNDIGASHENEEITNCIYGLKKSCVILKQIEDWFYKYIWERYTGSTGKKIMVAFSIIIA